MTAYDGAVGIDIDTWSCRAIIHQRPKCRAFITMRAIAPTLTSAISMRAQAAAMQAMKRFRRLRFIRAMIAGQCAARASPPAVLPSATQAVCRLLLKMIRYGECLTQNIMNGKGTMKASSRIAAHDSNYRLICDPLLRMMRYR